MKINIKLFIVMMMFALPLCLPLFPQETQTGPDTTPAEQQPAPAIPESPSTNEAPSTSPENAATPESPPAKQEEVKAPEDATATTAPQPSAAPSGEMKPTIIILKPLLSFEDVRTYTPSVEEASEESAYEERLLAAARTSIGTRMPSCNLKQLNPGEMEAYKDLQPLVSRVARGNITEEAKAVLSRLSASDEERIVLVQFCRLKTGPGRSWNPNSGAITSSVASTLVQAALVSCKSGTVLWKGEQYVRNKAVKPTSKDFDKILSLLYKDLDMK